jgi:hypothetical protein
MAVLPVHTAALSQDFDRSSSASAASVAAEISSSVESGLMGFRAARMVVSDRAGAIMLRVPLAGPVELAMATSGGSDHSSLVDRPPLISDAWHDSVWAVIDEAMPSEEGAGSRVLTQGLEMATA